MRIGESTYTRTHPRVSSCSPISMFKVEKLGDNRLVYFELNPDPGLEDGSDLVAGRYSINLSKKHWHLMLTSKLQLSIEAKCLEKKP